MPRGDEHELERLRALLEQERHNNDQLHESLNELRLTVEDLDKRVEGLDDDNSEWRTRYETQVETNQQLHLQSLVLTEKVEEAKRNLKDSRLPKNMRIFEDVTEATPEYVKTLERSKQIFESQLRDLEWRLEQESKAYHKANEERKNYVSQINHAKGTVTSLKQQPKLKHDFTESRPGHGGTSHDQYVVDQKKGPARRTAAYKVLPRLE